jgi:fructose-1,6-bisphosphatase/inositol monophosphatase family enzyme
MQPTIRLGQQAIKHAGKIVLRHYDRQNIKAPRHSSPLGWQNLLNDIVLNELFEHFSGKNKVFLDSDLRDDYTGWALHPIEGADLFHRQIPQLCLSMHYQQRGTVKHSIIYEPFHDLLFYASSGEGSFANNVRCRTRQQAENELYGISTGDAHACLQGQLTRLPLTGIPCLALPCPSLAAAYFASGRIGALIADAISPALASTIALIVKESGGLLSDWQGNPQYQSQLLAAPSSSLGKLVKAINTAA